MSAFQFPLWISALLSLFYFSADDKHLPSPTATRVAVEGACEEKEEEKLHKSLLAKKLIPPPDTIPPQNPNNHQGDATHNPQAPSPLFVPNPTNVVVTYELAPDGQGYYIFERVGGVDIKPPSYISFDDYIKYRREKLLFENQQEYSLQNNKEVKKGLIPTFDLGAVNDIFGGGPIEIKPTGMFSLNFAINTNKNKNPILSIRQQNNTYFDFDQQIQVGVNGQIGNKMKLNINQDTKATFDFENLLKLDYSGDEDQIIQRLASGNISMQTGNSLIQGSQNLFGLKAELKFGPVNVTALGSLQRGQKQTINVKSGAIETPFKKPATDYDANRHYFLSHYFRSKYDDALSRLPQIKSDIRINQVEVWVSNPNVNQTANLRPGIGFIDLGENNLPVNAGTTSEGKGVIFNPTVVQPNPSKRYPDKQCNNLQGRLIADPNIRTKGEAVPTLEAMGMTNGVDFQMVNLRKLQEGKDYTVQSQLGYVSLNSPLQSDDVLFVSFSYTIDGKAYQVGEFSNDVPSNANNNNPLFLKMLRPSQLRPQYNGKRYPVWDLMMKNIYSVAYGLSSNNFKLQIMYESGKQGKLAFLPTSSVANRPLIQVMNIDQLTNNTSSSPDNLFDYLEGLTILSDKGYIIFPVLEPFGAHLAKQIKNPDDSARYVYQPLYDMTYQDAITLHNDLNKYTIEGTYQGANNSEIPLNTFNVSPQSVTVTANGVKLVQGTDYEVDQAAGKVIIKNPAYMAPGQDIKVDVEQTQMYQMQTRTLAGLRAEMNLTDNIKIGAAMLHLNERPTTFKVTLGDEPLSNTIWGFDINGQKESKFLTKMIDKLPLISTKAPSNFTFSGEVAQFIPGQPRQLKNAGENGIIYLDDFEAAKQPYDLTSPANWKLASFPRYQPDSRLYDPSKDFTDKNAKNFSRAKLAWYRIDPQIYNNDVVQIAATDRTESYTRPVSPTEIFPTATVPVGSGFQSTLDLHYFPTERGSYNYQYDINKVGADGKFLNPRENWAGVMADIKMNTDFEAANVEFIEFWMMSPFLDQFQNNTGGQMYINLGNISEDVLPDNLQSFENALPLNDLADEVTVTDWARIPNTIPPSNSFSNGQDDRQYQDVGLDGMRDELEREYFKPYLDKISQNFGTGSPIYMEMSADPSTDNYTHHLANGDQIIPILERFKPAYGTEGNSKLGQTTSNGLTLQGTPYPDMEDLNRNGTANTWEEYFEYRLDIDKNAMVPGQNYIVDSINSTIRDGRGNIIDEAVWYQVRIPIKTGKAINNIPNFKVINFMRMYLTGFEQEAVMRITDLQLVSTQWRRYVGPSFDPPFPSGQAPEPPFSTMDIGSVSLQDNSKKEPFNYQMPPGINRQGINGNTSQNLLMDERSLLVKVCGLKDGESQGVFKNVVQDFRNYKNLRMWVHAEAVNGVDGNFNQTGDASIFVRLGLDNDYNYYEYEMPLTPSDLAKGQDPYNIWANAIDFALIRLTEAKQARNDANFSFGDRFTYTTGLPEGHKIYVKGTAKLSDVRSIFIGIRNPHAPTQGDVCLEVWLNELRLTDFDQEASWAANANMNVTLADIGSIQASLQYRQAGFGPLEQKLSQKGREDNLRYTLAGDFTMGKFFPQKWGINLPVHVNYDEQFKSPVFDPREADVKTKDLTRNMSKEEKDQALFEILDYTRNKGISLMNVKKNKSSTSKKSMPWDISNFDASFSFAEQYGHNYLTETRYAVNHKGGINYRYNIKSPNIQPFKKWKKKNPISDFNFSPFPNQVSVSLLADRQFTENKLRSTTFGGESDAVYTKNFVLSRNYTMAWDLTKNLKLNFTAANQARVDEVKGYWRDATQAQKDSVAPLADNLLHFGKDTALNPKFDKMIYSGRTIGYNHNINLQYNLPLKNYKWTDWISGTGTYTATFNWMNPPEAYPGLGATISNTRAIQTSGNLNMTQLYNKSKFLKKMLEVTPPPPPSKVPPKGKGKIEENEKGLDKEKPTKDKGKKDDKKASINPDWPDKYKLHPPKEYKFLKALLKSVVRLVLSLRKVDISYNQNDGTTQPGYMPKTDNLGLDFGYFDKGGSNISTPFAPPTLGFMLGDQKDIRGYAANYYWISRDTTLSNYYANTSSSQLTVRANVEPMPGFTIDLNATRNETNNFSELFRWDNQGSTSYYRFTDQQLNGTYSCSYVFIGSAFETLDTDKSKYSASFNRFSVYRQIISERLAAENPSTNTLAYQGKVDNGLYSNGYTGTAQDVLIPALLAGYGVINPKKIELSPFPKIPLPNWNVSFNPMTAFPSLKNTFQSVSIKHSYRGTYTIGSFNRNLNAQDLDGDGFADNTVYLETDINGHSVENFNSVRNIQLVQITEQMSPLIGVNATTKNGITIAASYGRGRQMTFNMGNLQLTDIRNQDLSISAGWRKDKLNLKFRFAGKDINLDNTLEAKVQITMRDMIERNRTLDGITSIPLRGQINWVINPYLDYTVSKRLSVKAFWQQNINDPHTSQTFKNSFRSVGVQLRFSLN